MSRSRTLILVLALGVFSVALLVGGSEVDPAGSVSPSTPAPGFSTSGTGTPGSMREVPVEYREVFGLQQASFVPEAWEESEVRFDAPLSFQERQLKEKLESPGFRGLGCAAGIIEPDTDKLGSRARPKGKR